MTLRRQIEIWVVVLVVFVALLWLLSDILLPFIAGMVLAYFLDPAADALERRGLPRIAATSVILLTSLLIFAALILLVVPILSGQIAKFTANLPAYLKGAVAFVDASMPEWIKQRLTRSGFDTTRPLTDFASSAAGWAASIIGSLWSGGLALVNALSLIVVTPVVAFYMLNDWDRMVRTVDSWLPRDHADTIRRLATEINDVLAGFIRGQGTLCLALGTFYAVALMAAGLDFGLLIGLVTGFLSFIPFVGAITGGLLSIGMAMVQFWPDWTHVLVIAGIFVLGQFLEGNVLQPRLVGHSVGLHPVWLMFALFAFGYLFGFVGVLLAVPMAAAMGVLTRFLLKQYLSSRLYLGTESDGAGAGTP
ncbi:MAG: AI-2E family transporter [Hyphomicrobiales bacterium]